MKKLFVLFVIMTAKVGFAQITATVMAGSPICHGTQTGSLNISSSGTPTATTIITNSQGDTINLVPNSNPPFYSTTVNLLAGDQWYYYSLSDNNGQTLNDSVFLPQPPPIAFTNTITQPNLPPDLGVFETTVTNGIYDLFFIMNSSNGGNFPSQNISSPMPVIYSGLDTGSYFLSVTDANGCNNDTSFIIAYQSPIPPISFNLQVTQPFSTPGFGSIAVQNIQGNISPISALQISVTDLVLNSFPVVNLVSNNLTPNTYLVSVTDTLTTMTDTLTAILQFQDLAIGTVANDVVQIRNLGAGEIIISGTQAEDFVTIYNIAGQKVLDFYPTEIQHHLKLSAGNYVLSLNRKGEIFNKKLISY